MRLINLAGQRFGRLVAQWPVGRDKHFIWWLCLCDCGGLKIAGKSQLHNRVGGVKSCGCLSQENHSSDKARMRGKLGGRQFIDITGKKFGRLTAQWPAGHKSQGKNAPMIHWLCSCECGKLVVVAVGNLGSGNSTSCGCYSKEVRGKCNLKHGKSRTPEYIMWQMAKHRAAAKGWPFDIVVEDVVIPALCPMLGIPIFQANGVLQDHSPQLDRRDNAKGYVKGNIRVISCKANRSKSDLTLEEMKLMVANWDR